MNTLFTHIVDSLLADENIKQMEEMEEPAAAKESPSIRH